MIGEGSRPAKKAKFGQRGQAAAQRSAGSKRPSRKSYFRDSMTLDPWTHQVQQLCERGDLASNQLEIKHDVVGA